MSEGQEGSTPSRGVVKRRRRRPTRCAPDPTSPPPRWRPHWRISPYANTLDSKTAWPSRRDSLVARNVAAYVRWNAMAMVARPHIKNHGIGGHRSYASYRRSRGRLQWFFKEDDLVRLLPGPLFVGRHAAPFVEGGSLKPSSTIAARRWVEVVLLLLPTPTSCPTSGSSPPSPWASAL